ncbi:MAG: hypothetical protein NC410_09285 [Oscillibacter sp.]|nr:hypothetical protein [Oscillibacter sp.]
MEDSVKERLRYFLKARKIKAIDFCVKIGVSSGFISGMRESIQPDKLKSIAINYPELDISWLMTGVGDMMKSNNQNIGNISNSDISGSIMNASGNVVNIPNFGGEKIIKENGEIELHGSAQSAIEKLEVEKSVLQKRIADLENMINMKDEIISLLKENINFLKQ